MIIDQLNATVTDNLTDEVPVEQGTLTYKTTWQKILALFKSNTTAADIATTNGNVQTDITAIQTDIGSTALPTTAQTLTGAIAEIHTDVANDVLYFTSVACSAMTGDFATVSNANITADHVVAECVFADPSYITSNVTWTSSSGSLVLNGTCGTATTVNLVLVKKDN